MFAFARLLLQYRLLSVLGVLVLIVVGVQSLTSLPIDAVPDVTNVQVQVLTSAPGLSPIEVEQLVTRHVERALLGLPKVTRTRSVSRAGVSAVTVVFEDGTDINLARQLVAQRIPAARENIPENAGRPDLGPLTTGLGEVYHFTVKWPGHSLMETRTLLDWEIAQRLRTVPGVVECNGWGGDTRQVQIRLRESAMLAARITPQQIEAAVRSAGVNVSGGYLERTEEGAFIRAEAIYRSKDDVARQVLSTDTMGRPLLVRDVAEVTDAPAPRLAAATADGKGETVYAMAQMITGGNAHEVVRAVKERLKEIESTLPEGVVIEPLYDRAAFVDEVLHTVESSLVEGGVVVAIVLLIMLGNLRAGLLVASVIPLSMLGAFVLMRMSGLSGNLLSLGALDFGLVVDGAVVVVEGTLAVMATRKLAATKALETVIGEVGRPVGVAVVIITVVFLPVLMLEGVEGKMFRPMALTMLFALATALVLTFTWVVAAGSVFLGKAGHDDPWVVRQLKRGYGPLCFWLLERWRLVSLAALLLAVGGAVAGMQLGGEFVPRLEEGALAIQVTRPPSVSMEEAVRGTSTIEQVLLEFPDVKRVVSRTGSPDVATDVMGLEQSDVFVLLKPRHEWKTGNKAADFANAFEPKLRAALPGTIFSFTQPIEMRVAELIGGVRSDVGIKIYGESLTTLRQLARRVEQLLRETQGSADVRSEPLAGLAMVTIQPDTREMGRLGVQPREVLDYLQMLRQGRTLGRTVEGEKLFDITMRLTDTPSADRDSLEHLRIPLSGGRWVRLGDVAHVTPSEGPAQVSREMARRRVLVEANVRGRDLASFVQEVQTKIGKEKLPAGYFVEYGGTYENLARATARLLVIVPITLVVVAALLFMTFGSARPAILIFINVPIAAAGGVFFLLIRRMDFSVSAAVGFLALFGVATLNGVVLLAAVRTREDQGICRFEAVREAALERLRPVLTTALVAALGFVPMAIATGTGAEVQRPLATVVIGGLITSTLVTLLALPALYVRFGGRGDPRAKQPPGAAGGAPDPAADPELDEGAEGGSHPAS